MLRLFLSLFMSTYLLFGCATSHGDMALTQNTYIELVDWHISGLWVINCPVAWIRVVNYNPVPIKDIEFDYTTYDAEGNMLNQGDYTIEGTVPANGMKNFIELYVGLVDLHSEKLSVQLKSVTSAEE